MIFGLGTDIIEVERVNEKLIQDSGFKETLFTEFEIKYCESKKLSAVNYAARYAAKEAFFKALGTGWRNGLSFKDVEIINDESGKPIVELYGKAREIANENKFTNIQVSLSHLKNIVNAVVIIEK